jgi:predicted dehydrogenase
VQKSDGKTSPWTRVAAKPVPTLYERFIRSIKRGVNDQPDFERGWKIQRALDACEKSHLTGKTIALS